MFESQQILVLGAEPSQHPELSAAAMDLDLEMVYAPSVEESGDGPWLAVWLLCSPDAAETPEMIGALVGQVFRIHTETPVILIDPPNDGITIAALNSGASDVWTPVSAEVLYARIRNMLMRIGAKADQIERRRKLEEQNRRMKRYVAVVAHDLRGPLGKLISTSEILLGGVDDPETLPAFYQIMVNAGRRGFDLVNNILDLAGLENEDVKMDLQPTQLRDLTKQIVEECDYRANEKQIDLQHDVQSLTVLVDSRRMLQVIANLVGNALKFTPQNGRVMLSARTVGNNARIEVSDSGVGMSPDQVDTLFSKDRRKKTTPGTDGERGTGMGLLISQEIVRAHGSHLRVQSTEGEGSIFTFSLPLHRS